MTAARFFLFQGDEKCAMCSVEKDFHSLSCAPHMLVVNMNWKKANPATAWTKDSDLYLASLPWFTDDIFGPPPNPTPAYRPACECGAAAVGVSPRKPGHSDWCPVK